MRTNVSLKTCLNKNELKKRLKKSVVAIFFRKNNGIYVINGDWDNLIILDACRYDLFKELNQIDGKLGYRYSRGTHTREFLLENFRATEYDDIVYVTAQPRVYVDLKNTKFYKTIHVWKDKWSDKHSTVHPKVMVDQTLKARKKYPNKRIISHFLQPHCPYISEDGVIMTCNVFNLLRKNEICKEKVWTGYKENLEYVLNYVGYLVSKLPGKTVITSDHGEAFGEKLHPLIPYPVYSHPPGVRIDELIKV